MIFDEYFAKIVCLDLLMELKNLECYEPSLDKRKYLIFSTFNKLVYRIS
jgi:hypothetical protein